MTLVLREEHQRKRAFQLQQSLAKGLRQRTLARSSDQVQDDFGVAGGLENGAFASSSRRSSAAFVIFPL